MSCFGVGTEIMVRRASKCCTRLFHSNQSMHVGNYVERYVFRVAGCVEIDSVVPFAVLEWFLPTCTLRQIPRPAIPRFLR